jgi:hypothetical protein
MIETNVTNLPPEVFSAVLAYVGPGCYRYVAGACKYFRESYRKKFTGSCLTDAESIASSKACALMYVEEAPEKVKAKELKISLNETGGDWRTKRTDVAYWAARYGNLTILEWLKKEGVDLDPPRLYRRNGREVAHVPFDGVGEGGQIVAAGFFIQNGLDFAKHKSNTFRLAASNGQLAFLKHFETKGYSLNDKLLCSEAAKGGHLHVVKYLRGIGCEWDGSTCQNAAESGSLAVLKYAHENGCTWSLRGTNAVGRKAAAGGHLSCLKYIHENGGPVDRYSVTLAASGGHLDCLLYLHENGFAADAKSFARAVEIVSRNQKTPALNVIWGRVDTDTYDKVEELVFYGERQYRYPESSAPRSGFDPGPWRYQAFHEYPCVRRFSKYPRHFIKGTGEVYAELKSALQKYSETGDTKEFDRLKERVEGQIDREKDKEFQELVKEMEMQAARHRRMTAGHTMVMR